MKDEIPKSVSPSDPIGIFDSGVGGLTVYRALRHLLPNENFIYLGDTAHLPYGTKSNELIEQYTVSASQMLCSHNIKFLVIACNTASAYGLDAVQDAFPDLLCSGVITEGVETATKVTRSGNVAILASEGTVRSNAYIEYFYKKNPNIFVEMLPCNLMVTLVEEGMCEGLVTENVISHYLGQLKSEYDTLLLGCTHFPLLLSSLRKICNPNVQILDCATAVAEKAKYIIIKSGLANPQKELGRDLFFVTDFPERFSRMAKLYLKMDISQNIQQVFMSVHSEKNVRFSLDHVSEGTRFLGI